MGKIAHLHANVTEWVKYIRVDGVLLDLTAHVDITLPFVEGRRIPMTTVHYDEWCNGAKERQLQGFIGGSASLQARIFLLENGFLPYE